MQKVEHDFQVANREISFGNVYMIVNTDRIALLFSIVIYV